MEKKKIKSKDLIKAIVYFTILVVFVYFSGHAIGEAISYIK